MLCLPGSPAHSEFRLRKLQDQLTSAGISLNGLSSHYIHLIDCDKNAIDAAALEVLQNLLSYGPALKSASVGGQQFYVVPRPGTISPWASKATDIAHNCGLDQIRRLERGILLCIDSNDELPLELLHDRMIESVFTHIDDCAVLFENHEPRALVEIDALAGGQAALQQANVELGLALSADEIDYLAAAYGELGRNPSSIILRLPMANWGVIPATSN